MPMRRVEKTVKPAAAADLKVLEKSLFERLDWD